MVKHTEAIRRLLPTNCLSAFDHFVRLVLKFLTRIVTLPSCKDHFPVVKIKQILWSEIQAIQLLQNVVMCVIFVWNNWFINMLKFRWTEVFKWQLSLAKTLTFTGNNWGSWIKTTIRFFLESKLVFAVNILRFY